ncbi:MAG: diadenylate cyclase CdaA [Desulfobulbaceae bacterium]
METIAFLAKAVQQFSDWRVLLDILFFTVILYLLYRTLRATGTWQIVLGLTIAAAGAGLASLAGLRGVEWLFSNFSQVALIALLIIFQPEIRKVLERTTSLLHAQAREETVGFAALIGDVLQDLARRRWGGIIVIPGNDALTQWVSEGIRVDAVPSLSLFLSIFDPGSPGHDGAVIIENGRIGRIAVRLPLSQANNLPEVMGTRHHASQGLSEKTDALILTVSEERGTISIFKGGRRTTVTEKDAIASAILDHGGSLEQVAGKHPEEKKRYSWRRVMEAGCCFFIACLFWFTVVMSRTQAGDMIFTVPVQYTNLQSNLVLDGDIPQSVKLHLEGPLSTLTTMDLSLLKVVVDLTGLGEGQQSIFLSEANVQAGKKVRVLDITPDTFDIRLSPLEKRVLPVEPQFVGSLPDGYSLGTIEVTPSQIPVLIAEREYKKDKQSVALRTTPIYLHGLREDTTVFCKIISPPGAQAADRRWPDIEVKITVKRTETK